MSIGVVQIMQKIMFTRNLQPWKCRYVKIGPLRKLIHTSCLTAFQNKGNFTFHFSVEANNFTTMQKNYKKKFTIVCWLDVVFRPLFARPCRRRNALIGGIFSIVCLHILSIFSRFVGQLHSADDEE